MTMPPTTADVVTADQRPVRQQIAAIMKTGKVPRDLFRAGLVKATIHLAAGHQAVAVGASAVLAY
jgi:hypothetical protein